MGQRVAELPAGSRPFLCGDSGVAAGKGHGVCECGGGAAKGCPTSREPHPHPVLPLAELGLL